LAEKLQPPARASSGGRLGLISGSLTPDFQSESRDARVRRSKAADLTDLTDLIDRPDDLTT
jgi:hypothetical protein